LNRYARSVAVAIEAEKRKIIVSCETGLDSVQREKSGVVDACRGTPRSLLSRIAIGGRERDAFPASECSSTIFQHGTEILILATFHTFAEKEEEGRGAFSKDRYYKDSFVAQFGKT